MNAYNVYRMYLALRLHFTSKKFDFFKAKGITRASVDSYNKRPIHEIRKFENIAAIKEPKTFLIGNMIFNKSNYIGDFNNKEYLEYRKFLVNGDYIFQEDIKKLKLPYKENFTIENSNAIPYIIHLLTEDEISLFTASAINRINNWTEGKDNFITEEIIQHINKSSGFFKYNDNIIKQSLIRNAKQENMVGYTD